MSAIEDDAAFPLVSPGRRIASVPEGATIPGMATPEHIPFEETGKVAAALEEELSAVEGSPVDQNDLITRIAEKLIEKGSGSGNDGGIPPAQHAKSIKRHNWGTIVLALLLGPGGVFTAIYAMDSRSKGNSQEVQTLQKSDKAMGEQIDRNTQDVQSIKTNLNNVSTAIGNIQTQQTEISNGIKALKQENVVRLQRELEDARRELRRRRRLDDD